jgi:exocyst complex component 6
VEYLAEFVDSLENAPILKENLDELQQTVNLMQTENPDEFFDVATRNKKFGRVDALNGPRILEKYGLKSHYMPPPKTDTIQAHPHCAESSQK